MTKPMYEGFRPCKGYGTYVCSEVKPEGAWKSWQRCPSCSAGLKKLRIELGKDAHREYCRVREGVYERAKQVCLGYEGHTCTNTKPVSARRWKRCPECVKKHHRKQYLSKLRVKKKVERPIVERKCQICCKVDISDRGVRALYCIECEKDLKRKRDREYQKSPKGVSRRLKWTATNRDHLRESSRNWRKQNPDKIEVFNRKQKTKVAVKTALRLSLRMCSHCGEKMDESLPQLRKVCDPCKAKQQRAFYTKSKEDGTAQARSASYARRVRARKVQIESLSILEEIRSGVSVYAGYESYVDAKERAHRDRENNRRRERRATDPEYREIERERKKKTYHSTDPETRKAKKRERYIANREKILAQQKAFRDNNADTVKAKNKASRLRRLANRTPEQIIAEREYNRQYRAKHRDRINQSNAKYREKKRRTENEEK